MNVIDFFFKVDNSQVLKLNISSFRQCKGTLLISEIFEKRKCSHSYKMDFINHTLLLSCKIFPNISSPYDIYASLNAYKNSLYTCTLTHIQNPLYLYISICLSLIYAYRSMYLMFTGSGNFESFKY